MKNKMFSLSNPALLYSACLFENKTSYQQLEADCLILVIKNFSFCLAGAKDLPKSAESVKGRVHFSSCQLGSNTFQYWHDEPLRLTCLVQIFPINTHAHLLLVQRIGMHGQ